MGLWSSRTVGTRLAAFYAAGAAGPLTSESQDQNYAAIIAGPNDCDQPAATGRRIHAAGRKRGSVESFGSWVAVAAAVDDRRPVSGASSYRAAAAVASISFRVAAIQT
jgi:hypothetical protein